MQACRRPLAPSEVDHELIWLVVSLVTIVFLAIWFATRLPTPQCFFHHITGLPCPTCGATRAACQFLHGHFADSFRFNPLAFLAYCGIVIFDLYAAVVLLARAPRIRLVSLSPNESRFVRAIVVAAFLSNWLYLIVARLA
jgi:hypothetical protein